MKNYQYREKANLTSRKNFMTWSTGAIKQSEIRNCSYSFLLHAIEFPGFSWQLKTWKQSQKKIKNHKCELQMWQSL